MTLAGPLIAHRGASARLPENTIPAIKAAYADGCGWVEIDVQVSADGEAVLMHDHTVDRTTNGEGPVAMMSGAAVTSLRTRCPLTGAITAAQVPHLWDVLTLCGKLGLGLVLEIKATWGVDAEDAKTVAKLLPQAPAFPLIVTSFSVLALGAMAAARPDVALGLACLRPPVDPARAAHDLHLSAIHANAQYTTAADLERVRAAGLQIAIATINDADAATEFLRAGAHGVMTDEPKLLDRIDA